MTPHKQYGDILCFSSFFMLEHLAIIAFDWMGFFTSVKFNNGYVDLKMSPSVDIRVCMGEISFLS